MSGTSDDAKKPGTEAKPSATDETHTAGGAPTRKAHEDAGDGALAGSIPGGLSSRELRELAESDKTTESGTS
ncbi:hypothetical protein [Roseomonas chloroacetimidivorans]|jgi:hypothetical protein|uniref:hypothetical protein n=1 Tax=Roseomonas chloroacetimidivorans TaxID=1766656 RepID=UPI003C75BFE1